MRWNLKIVTIIICAVAVLSFSIPVTLYSIFNHSLPPATQQIGSHGPEILIHAGLTGVGSAAYSASSSTPVNLSNISVAVFSPVPDSLSSTQGYNVTGLNQTNNSYEVRLFQGQTNSTGVLEGFLGSEFYNIVKEWNSDKVNGTDAVSMMLYATYFYRAGNNIYSYYYYNNLPYDPLNPEYTDPGSKISQPFNISFSIDLQGPVTVIPLNNTTVAAAGSKFLPNTVIIPGPCPASVEYDTKYSQTRTVPLPLMAGDLNLPSNSEFTFGFSSFTGNNLEMSFNSATKNTMDNFAVMSSRYSWQGTDGSFSSLFGTSSANPSESKNLSMIYLPDVYLHVVATQIYYLYTYGKNCRVVNGGISTSLTVTGVYNSNFNPKISFLSNIANSPYWYAIFDAMHHSSTGSKSLPANNTYSSWDFTGSATGYNSAASAEQTLENAVSVTFGALGAALAIGIAAGLIPGADSADSAVNEVAASLASASLTLAVLSAFSSIEWSATLDMTYNAIGIGNLVYSGTGSTLNVEIFQSTIQTALSISGSTYSANMPLSYVIATPQ